MAASLDFRSRREAVLWLAGLFDGEGCLTKRYNKVKDWSTWAASVRMTDKDSLEFVAGAITCCIGKAVNVLGPYHNGRKNEKPIYAIDLQGKEYVYALVVMLYPYVNSRRKARMEEFIEWYKER